MFVDANFYWFMNLAFIDIAMWTFRGTEMFMFVLAELIMCVAFIKNICGLPVLRLASLQVKRLNFKSLF